MKSSLLKVMNKSGIIVNEGFPFPKISKETWNLN